MAVLANFLNICKKNGFFHSFQLSDGLPTSLIYGPMGSLLRRNIKREWLFSLLNNPDANLLPLEIITPVDSLADKSINFTLPALMQNYHCLHSLGYRESVAGFAAYGFSQTNNGLFEDSILRRLKSHYLLVIAFFCVPKKSSDWFNYWSKNRYRWWRKFSSLPSKFSISDVVETDSGGQQVALMLECPWGEEKLETVTCHSSESIKTLCTESYTEFCPVDAVVCQTELDLGTLAYLSNSFAEKWRDKQLKQLLQLSVKLAPYKVALTYNTQDADIKKLKDIATHLDRELKKCEIMLLPQFSENYCDFTRLDEIGVPYAVVLDNKSLQCGVAGLRHRDSTLQEQIHISELRAKLLKYLQMEWHV